MYAVGAAIGLSVLAFRWLPKQIARCNFYMFLSSVLYVNLSGSQDFWFTADEKCVPGGPAFDYTYYNSYTWIVGTLDPKPETPNPRSETRNPKPGTRDPKPETLKPKPPKTNPTPQTPNPKTKTPTPEPSPLNPHP